MAGIEGELVVRLACEGGRVRDASVCSTRPLAVPRLLAGREVHEAAGMVPLVYSVCANAQGAAAAAALEAAGGAPVQAAALRARSLAVTLEALQEDLRRLVVDLPAAAGTPGDLATLARAHRDIAPMLATLRGALGVAALAPAVADEAIAALGNGLQSLVEARVLGMPATDFVRIDTIAAYARWARRSGTATARAARCILETSPGLGASDVRPMPRPSASSLASAVLAALDADPDYVRAPRWHGATVETGALARRADHPGIRAIVQAHGNDVAARLLARLLDVASAVMALARGGVERCVEGWSPRPGEGVASVETARGLLLHRARVAGTTVVDYAIVAPTEWNFHPEGALARGLRGLSAGDERSLSRDVTLVVGSLDPCVACRVEIGHA